MPVLRVCGRALALALFMPSACSQADNQAPSAIAAASQRDLAAELAEIDACGYVGCRGPFYDAPELDFGLFAMGADMPGGLPSGDETSKNCTRAHFQNYGPGQMCGFTTEGVIYVLLDGKVIGKHIDVDDPPSAGLPFDLRSGQTPEEALTSLRAHTDAPFSVKIFPGGDVRYVGNDKVLKNSRDHPFLFSLLFVNDRLARIMLQDPSAPAD